MIKKSEALEALKDFEKNKGAYPSWAHNHVGHDLSVFLGKKPVATADMVWSLIGASVFSVAMISLMFV